MKRRFAAPLLSLVLLTVLTAPAQVAVELKLGQEKFLPGEEFEVAVRVVNNSGQTLQLGAAPDWVRFNVESLDGRSVTPTSEPPVENPFTLDSTKRGTLRVDLAPHFDLRRPGRYRISASVFIREWNRAFPTAPVEFEVVDGTRMWEQEFGVPAAAPGTPPEMRRYALQQANYNRQQLRLFIRVSAADGSVLKLISAGPMISFSHPEPRVDRRSRLHVLYQSGPKTFEYLVVGPDGELELRQTHEYTETRPRLRLDDTGELGITGGARVPRATDLGPAAVAKDDTGKNIAP